MLSNKKFLTLMAVCGTLASCSVDEIKVPEQELFARQFIKSYGIIDPSQDWSVAKKESVTVSVAGETSVRITARHDGKMILLGDFKNVSGTQELTFDCPKQVQEVIVSTPSYMQKVPVGGSVSVGSPASRATTETDLAYSCENGYYWSAPYVNAIQEVLPEGNPRNLVSNKMVADFSFVSDGKPVTIYPVYWQTTSHDELGVYWYEDGQMKTKVIFDNQHTETAAVGTNTYHYHNIYHRSSVLTPTASISNNATEVPVEGDLVLTFPRNIKATAEHSAKIGNTVLEPKIGDDNRTVTYHYSGFGYNEKLTFTLAAKSFETTDNKPVRNGEFTINFTTIDSYVPAWESTEFKPNSDLKSGSIVITFTKPVKVEGKVSFTAADKTEAILGEPVLTSDNLKVNIAYSSCKFETTYTLTIPDDFATHATHGDKADLTGYDKNGANTYTTPADPNPAEPTLPSEFTFAEMKVEYATGNGEITATSGTTNIVEEDTKAPFSAILYFSGTPKVTQTNIPSVKFNNPAKGEVDKKFEYGVKTAQAKNLSGKYDDKGISTITDGDKSMVVITPTQDIFLTVYTIAEYKSDTSNPKTRQAKLYDNTSATYINALTADAWDSNSQTIGDKLYIASERTFNLKSGHSYIITTEAGNALIAGLAYGIPDTTRSSEPGSVIHRNPRFANGGRPASREGGLDKDTFGVNGSIPSEIYPDNLAENGFVRGLMNSAAAVTKDDEIITHKITFTIPKGVIFGFFIHNNAGAAQITGDGLTPKDYYNYSTSALNQSMPNSFFNHLDTSRDPAKYFTEGWGTKYPDGNGPDNKSTGLHGKLYYTETDYVNVPENRKYSTASTYTVDVEGNTMRYFSFEDWVDYDFNDIAFMVAPENQDIEVIEGEVETHPYIFAVEDLGATTETDIDFNDVVFAVEHVPGHASNKAYVTMLAAGGTLRAELLFNGQVVGNEIGTVVSGPLFNQRKVIENVNDWFGVDTYNTTINVGSGHYTGFGNLTTVEIDVDKDFSIAKNLDTDNHTSGFSVRVYRNDGTTTDITRPDATGQAPQIIILPGTWHWPLERVPIHEAYPGGINYDGTPLSSFGDWVKGGDGGKGGFKNLDWHKAPVEGKVMFHIWTGSEAARQTYGTK